jgi:hypothetical protein
MASVLLNGDTRPHSSPTRLWAALRRLQLRRESAAERDYGAIASISS